MMKRQQFRSLVLLISLLLLPVFFFYLSPVLILEGASSGIVTGSALVFAFIFFFSLFCGRIWCGWICPFGSLQDKTTEIRDTRITNPWFDRFRYLFFVGWFGLLIGLFAQAGGILSVDPFYETTGGLSVAGPLELIIYTAIILLIVVVTVVVGRRGMCHLFCPISVIMIIGRRLRNIIGLPAFQLTADEPRCIRCGRCTRECSQSLDVLRMVEEDKMEQQECILCGVCVDSCPKKVIHLGFGRPPGE
ncbi:MAG TPA: 4Fe-4S binding protein [Methanospirillum sp.]|nr:4Fe-4S binding protein [Methanospirillum sp.]